MVSFKCYYFILVEWLTYSCFNNQMKRLLPNFPPATEIDKHFAHTGALTQVQYAVLEKDKCWFLLNTLYLNCFRLWIPISSNL